MIYHDSLYRIASQAFKNWNPPPERTLSQWADEKFYLSPESAAEPGKWRTYSYQRGPMDAFTDPLIERITIMKSARVGYTKMINCAIGYHIDQDPCSQLVVQPTIDDANGYSKDEIQVMLRDTPALNGRVSEAKSRDSKNTILKKSYPGGTLTLVGANSARGFRRLTVRNVYFDEVDGYPPTAGHEGDQIQLGVKRSETFWNRKIALGSTPTIKGMSRIESSFETSDQRFYFVPCPFCGHFQTLKWSNIKWPADNPHRAYYLCENCEKEIDHKYKRQMVDAGQWRATKPFNGHAGFFLWAIYSFSPGAAWGKIAERQLDAKQYFKNHGDLEKLKTWVNTDLGETWEERGDGVESIELTGNKTPIKEDTAPEGVLCITAGVDVQDDRIEVEIVGWGDGQESWSLDWVKLPGDPERQDVWDQLDAQINRTFKRGGAHLHINCVAVDHGHHTHQVETFVKPRQIRRVYAVKGLSQPGKPLVNRPSKKSIRKGVQLFGLGTDTAKDVIMGRLKIEKPGPGYCHFPDHYPEEYFKQLTAEEAVVRYSKGVKTRVWKKKRLRNEALDLRVYALAALVILNPVFDKIRKNIQRAEEKMDREQPKPKITKKTNPQRKRRGGFVNNW